MVSFYFSKFLENCKARDFGEVSIVPIRNKLGKKFGLTRFKEVQDARLLAVKLDNMIVKGKKIHVNLLKFEKHRGNEVVNRGKGMKRAGLLNQFHYKEKACQVVFESYARMDGRTFAEVVVNILPKEVNDVKCILWHSFREEDRNIFAKAMVGEVLFLGFAYRTQAILDMEGFYSIMVSVLDPNLCLLEEVE